MSNQRERSTASPAPTAKRALFIDSIEAGVARLIETEAGEVRSHAFPAALLPAGAGEGTWVEIEVRTIPAPVADDPAALRKKLIKGDPGGDISL